MDAMAALRADAHAALDAYVDAFLRHHRSADGSPDHYRTLTEKSVKRNDLDDTLEIMRLVDAGVPAAMARVWVAGFRAQADGLKEAA